MKRLKPEIKRFISTKDIIPKAVCLLLSVLLWTYINSTKVGDVKFRIPIEFKNISEELVISEVKSKYITVSLTGRKDILKSINVKSINAFVNLGNPVVGISKRYPIKVIKHGLPESIELNLSSKDIAVTVDRKMTKVVKIEPNILEKIRDGYVLGYVKIIPQYITINGPESYVKNVDLIKTNMISIGDETGRIEREVFLDKNGLSNIDLDINKVRLIISIIEDTNLYKVEKKIEIKNSIEGYKYILSKQYVKIYLRSGDEDIKPSKEDVMAFIDIASINIMDLLDEAESDYIEKDYLINVDSKQEGVNVITVLPDTISVKIMKLSKKQ